MNRSISIIEKLREHGIDAYLPGSHEGICLSPYAVVRQMSCISADGGGIAVYRVILLVPQEQSELLDALAQSAADALSNFGRNGIKLTQPRGAVTTDEAFCAVTTYLEYVSYYS